MRSILSGVLQKAAKRAQKMHFSGNKRKERVVTIEVPEYAPGHRTVKHPKSAIKNFRK